MRIRLKVIKKVERLEGISILVGKEAFNEEWWRYRFEERKIKLVFNLEGVDRRFLV